MDTLIIVGIVCCILLFLSSSIIVGIFYVKAPVTPPVTQPPVTQQPITQPPVTLNPLYTKKPANLINFAGDTTKYMAWDGMMYKTNQDTKNLGYIISCGKPWDAYYKFGCTLPSSDPNKAGSTQYTNAFGPVSKNNWQGPDIRIAPDGQQNFCAQLGGTLSVLRQRPGDKEMLDITDQLQNSTTTDVYNGVDPVFVDNYNTDC